MTLEEFAQTHGLKVVGEMKSAKQSLSLDGRPKPDVEHIPAKKGWITTDKVFLTGQRVAFWLTACSLGMMPQGRGDRELMLRFDMNNPEQAAWAIKTVRARHKRRVSAKQREGAKARMAEFWSLRKLATVA